MQRPQPPGQPGDPMHQGRAIEHDPLAGQYLRLPVQRRVAGEFHHRHMHEQCRGWQPAIDRPRRRLCLHNRPLARTAAIARPMNAFDAQHRRHHVEHLADIRADHMQLPRQQRQAWLAGSIVMSTRGRCAGSPPILRAALAATADLCSPAPAMWRVPPAWRKDHPNRAAAGPRAQPVSRIARQTRPASKPPRRPGGSRSPPEALHSIPASALDHAENIGHPTYQKATKQHRCAARKLQQFPRIFRRNRGPHWRRRTSCVQSMPATSRRICAGLKLTAPSCTGGQVNPPASNRLVTRQSPVPSQSSSLSRSARLARSTKTSPAWGYVARHISPRGRRSPLPRPQRRPDQGALA